MSQVIRMPMMGNTMETGLLVEWRVSEGDTIEESDIIAIVESEKTSAEVVAERDGVLARLDVAAGEEVPPGTVLGIITGPDESLDDVPAPRSRIEPDAPNGSSNTDAGGEAQPAADVTKTEPNGQSSAVEQDAPPADDAGTADEDAPDMGRAEANGDGVAAADGRTIASPSTRRLARKLGVSIADISGTGVGPRVTDSDVRAASGEIDGPEATSRGTTDATEDQREPRDPATLGVTVEREQELSSMRQTIADRMSQSARQAPHVTNKREIAVGDALAAADDLTAELDVRIGFTDMLIAAVVRALDRHPEFNAWFEAGRLRHVAERNVAVAVDTNAGLVTPVIREAGDRSIRGIATERRRLTDLALDGNYTKDDLSGGTFTITNLGMFDVDSFDPIINPPQVSILGVGRVRDENEKTRCTLSLSFDHRALDGADAARFLDTVATGLAAPSVLAASWVKNGHIRESSAESSTERNRREPDDIDTTVASDIREQALEIATAHDWPVPEFDVDLHGDRPTISVTASDAASPATMRRLTYAACRESAYAGTISELHNPELAVDCE